VKQADSAYFAMDTDGPLVSPSFRRTDPCHVRWFRALFGPKNGRRTTL